jgi:hypothetical protein
MSMASAWLNVMATMTTPRHRVTTAVTRMRAEADAVADASVWSMDAEDTAATLIELHRLEAQVCELEARVAAHADSNGLGREVGASSTAAWLAHATRQTRGAARATVELGHDLEQHPLTRDALAAGELGAAQVRPILTWVGRLPAGLGRDLVEKAERHLLDRAGEHHAKDLNRLGKRLFEVVAPDLADAEEARLLAREEAKAVKTTYLTGYDDGHGRAHFTGVISSYHWAALRKALGAVMAPKHQNATLGAGASRTSRELSSPEALGQALCEYIERYPTDRLPKTGGINATLVVTIDHQTLLGDLEKAGVLDTGERISPALARRLACEAGIVPAVMGGASQPLDLGRKRRLFSDYQRLAMFLRDRGCRAEGCDRVTALHAHHKTRWTDGGTTDLNHAVSCATGTT